MSTASAYAPPVLDEHGPRSVLALLGLILGVIPFTALVGVVLSVTAFFHLNVSQHRGQRQAGIGFAVGVFWLIATAITLAVLLH